jgi:4'-phosphopantetheinyl transferase
MTAETQAPEVAIFRADVPASPAAVEALTASLTMAEQTWAARLAVGGPRERFVAGRAALRRLLSQRLGVPPREVALRSGAGGKPELDVPGTPPLHFSVSHSGAVVLVAIATGPIGIDLEGPRQLRHALEVAARTFARSELELLARLPSVARPRRFLEIWTAKEAVLKASEGLPGLRGVEVTPGPDGAICAAGAGDGRWAVRTFEPAPGYVGAVAAESLPAALEILSARA